MPDTGLRAVPARPLAGPLHAILLAFPLALYTSALISDITYVRSAVVQWTNFSQWLIAGADVFAGLLLAWALVAFFLGRGPGSQGRGLTYLLVVAAMGTEAWFRFEEQAEVDGKWRVSENTWLHDIHKPQVAHLGGTPVSQDQKTKTMPIEQAMAEVVKANTGKTR